MRLNSILFSLPFTLQSVAGFVSYDGRRLVKNLFTCSASETAIGDTGLDTSLDGIAEFEEWFASNASSGAKVNNIRHALFRSTGRGLQFTSSKSSDLNKVAVVPRKLVMHVPYSHEESSPNRSTWDSSLSCKLWEECQKGKGSDYYGYCALLTRGANLHPTTTEYPSTATDSLRHWTATQKWHLEKSETGTKLLEAESKQQEEWRHKYNSLSTTWRDKMTYENFQWAMEAVHSRAFRGDFGALDGGEGGPLRKIASLLLPISALAFGVVYATDPSMDQYFVPLALIAASPVVLTILADQKGSKEAVMLPLIDSANHLQEADSVIEYDPSVDGFVLSLGRKCLVKEVDGDGERAQACISYGIKSDSELLINYGFLRGVMNDQGSQEEKRQRLAEEFVRRNP